MRKGKQKTRNKGEEEGEVHRRTHKQDRTEERKDKGKDKINEEGKEERGKREERGGHIRRQTRKGKIIGRIRYTGKRKQKGRKKNGNINMQ